MPESFSTTSSVFRPSGGRVNRKANRPSGEGYSIVFSVSSRVSCAQTEHTIALTNITPRSAFLIPAGKCLPSQAWPLQDENSFVERQVRVRVNYRSSVSRAGTGAPLRAGAPSAESARSRPATRSTSTGARTSRAGTAVSTRPPRAMSWRCAASGARSPRASASRSLSRARPVFRGQAGR